MREQSHMVSHEADLLAYGFLFQRAPRVLARPFGQDVLELVSLVMQAGHMPILLEDEDGTLEVEVRLNANETLLLSVTPEGFPEAIIERVESSSQPRFSSSSVELIPTPNVAGVVRYLQESRLKRPVVW